MGKKQELEERNQKPETKLGRNEKQIKKGQALDAFK